MGFGIVLLSLTVFVRLVCGPASVRPSSMKSLSLLAFMVRFRGGIAWFEVAGTKRKGIYVLCNSHVFKNAELILEVARETRLV